MPVDVLTKLLVHIKFHKFACSVGLSQTWGVLVYFKFDKFATPIPFQLFDISCDILI